MTSNKPLSTIKPHLVVVGNGMVGHHFVEQVIAQGGHENFQITVFGEEPHLAYDRVHLSEYFTGKGAADLAMTDGSLYDDNGVRYFTNSLVTQIDRAAKLLVLKNGDIVLR
jgi:nitrite reductase (NADH) large subunit